MRKNKKNFTNKKKRFILLNSFLVLFLVLGLGYSVLSANLNIFGDVTVKKKVIPPGIVIEVVPTSTPPNGDKYDYHDEVTFSVTVTNNYPYEIHDVTIGEDNIFGEEFSVATLGAYDSYTIPAQSVPIDEDMILAGYVDFHYYVNGFDEEDNEVNTEYPYHFTDIAAVNPNFEVNVNYDSSRTYNFNDVFNYSISVQNTGNVKLTSVNVKDLLADRVVTRDELTQNSIFSSVGFYTITEADVLDGQILLEAEISANDHTGREIKKEWSSVITLNAAKPRLDFTYEVEQVGNTYVFRFNIQNSGNVTVSTGNLSIKNGANETTNFDIIGLASGDERTFEYTYNIPDDPEIVCYSFEIFTEAIAPTGDESLIYKGVSLGDCK